MSQRQASKYPVESIPSEDSVSRSCFAINGIRQLDPATDFKFSAADHEEFPLALSVAWRKYAVQRYEMDQYGEMVAKIKNHRYGKKKGSANFAYIGYRTAVVGAIRAIRTERNFRFSVTHAPSNTFRAHAHVSIENSGDASEQVLMPNDRRELMHELIHAMPVDEAPPDA